MSETTIKPVTPAPSSTLQEIPADTSITVVSPADAAKLRLLDPRTIAEQHSPGTWEALEQERREVTEALSRLPLHIRELSKQHETITEQREVLTQEKGELCNEMQKRSATVASHFHRLFGGDPILEEMREKLDQRVNEIEEITTAIESIDRELIEARRHLDSLPDPDRAIERFSDEMLRTPLSVEERKELMRPEVLSALSLEEYVQVWRRINPYFVSHVTRQGIRDHTAMIYHSAGMHAYHDGFESILRNGDELRPPRVVHDSLDPTCRDSIERFLTSKGVFDEPTMTAAQELFDRHIHETLASAPKYPDSGAIHFAAQTVLDDYYGGESNNEIFAIYPADLIASQYCFGFNGWSADFTRPQTEDKWNDVFVWDQERVQIAIPLDAGIVFLPRSTMVDPVTGSRYALSEQEESGKTQYVPARHQDFDKRFAEWCEEIPKEGELAQAILKLNSLRVQKSIERDPHEFGILKNQIEETEDSFKQVVRATLQQLQTPADIAEHMYENLLKLAEGMTYNNWLCDGVRSGEKRFCIDEFYRRSFDYLRPASNPIPAMQYWESRFDREPEIRPRHIVYYDGTPREAVARFLTSNGISSRESARDTGNYGQDSPSQEDLLLGFGANHVTDIENDPRANRGLEELTRIGHELIAERFTNHRSTKARSVGNG